MGIVLNDQQDECVKKAVAWFRKMSSKQTFEISGPAGSGKTTIVRTIIQELGINMEDVLFVAYVGKAALQLSRSGVNGRTIHSTFYDIDFVPVKGEDGNILIKNGKLVTRPEFVKKERIPKNIKTLSLPVLECTYYNVDEPNNYFTSINGIIYNEQETVINKVPKKIKGDMYYGKKKNVKK